MATGFFPDVNPVVKAYSNRTLAAAIGLDGSAARNAGLANPATRSLGHSDGVNSTG